MADFVLKESAPFEGCDLPVSLGAARLETVGMGAIFAISPLKGQMMGVASALKSVAGITLPKTGTIVQGKNIELVWFAQGQWLAFLPEPDAMIQALTGLAAMSDQSDGWAFMQLSGAGAIPVLARLCPLDFDALSVGWVARSDFAHVPAMIIPRENGFLIGVPRSFAQSVLETTIEAMKSFAAQALV